ncbi:MAG: hypothetical protein ACYDA3_10855 [Gaiellaceae bacterium]
MHLSLSASGQGRWSIQGDSDAGSLALNYKWTGSFAFTVLAAKLNDPAHTGLAAKAVGTLTGTWVGDLVGTRFSPPNAGKYHCSYSGTNVRIHVNAQLVGGSKHLQLIMRRGSGMTMTSSGFFPDKGGGAKVECSNAVGDAGPTHFLPSWLFRDTTSDNGAFSSAQATIVLPATVLPSGRAAVTFPHEVGSVNSALRDKLVWKNTGRVVAVAR